MSRCVRRRTARSSGLWLALSCVLACSSTGTKAEHYPRDSSLKINQLQALATHNSYHVEKPGNTVPAWAYTHDPLDVQLGPEGIRGLELDTIFDSATGTLMVEHVPSLDDGTVCKTLAICLSEIKAWSDAHAGHQILFIQIEPKEPSEPLPAPNYPAYADALDATIASVWPRERMVAPADVQGSAATLRDAVTAGGWPTLGATRGKILVYLNERTVFFDAYTRGGSDISGRLVFPESHVDEPIGGVLIQNDPTDPTADIAGHVQQGFIVRTTVDGVPYPTDADTRRAAGLSSGAQIVSTDYPVAGDGGQTAFTIPGGTPSRCNPLTASSGCTSTDIENPAFLAGN